MNLTKQWRWLNRLIRRYPAAFMAGGLVFILIIGLMIVAVQTSLTYQEVYHDYATHEARTDAQEKFRQECLRLSSVKEVADCFDDAIEAAREPQRSEEDLQAQKQMADWARLMLYVTFAIGIVSFVVTVVSVLLIRETLDLQRNATREATKATRAATTANELSREAFLADQRPWVRIIQAQVNGPVIWNTNGYNFKFTFLIRNIGKSPAVDTQIRFKIIPDMDGISLREEQVKFADEIRKEPRNNHMFIFPDETVEQKIGGYITNQSALDSINRRKIGSYDNMLNPFIIGCVDYYSTLDEISHQTPFIYKIVRIVDNRMLNGFNASMDPAPIEHVHMVIWSYSGRID